MYVRICSSAEEAARSPVCVVCPAMAAQHAKSNYQKALEKVEEKNASYIMSQVQGNMELQAHVCAYLQELSDARAGRSKVKTSKGRSAASLDGKQQEDAVDQHTPKFIIHEKATLPPLPFRVCRVAEVYLACGLCVLLFELVSCKTALGPHLSVSAGLRVCVRAELD